MSHAEAMIQVTLDAQVAVQGQKDDQDLWSPQTPKERMLLVVLKGLHDAWGGVDPEDIDLQAAQDVCDLSKAVDSMLLWPPPKTDRESKIMESIMLLQAIVEGDEPMQLTLQTPESMVADSSEAKVLH